MKHIYFSLINNIKVNIVNKLKHLDNFDNFVDIEHSYHLIVFWQFQNNSKGIIMYIFM